MADEELDVEVDIDPGVVMNMILADPAFANQVRLILSQDVRGKGNTLGKWAQREPRPKAIQPNTVQRIFS